MAMMSILKKLGAAALGAGSSLVIAACYGAYYGGWNTISRGQVQSPDATGIPQMQVCVDLTSGAYCESTDINGDYVIADAEATYEEANSDGFTLQVRDVDGLANGEWADKDVNVGPGEAGLTHDVTVEPVQ